MKDNNENLNNELNDDEMEAVAGGTKEDWTPEQVSVLKQCLYKWKEWNTRKIR